MTLSIYFLFHIINLLQKNYYQNLKNHENQHPSLVLPMSESEDDLRLSLKSDSREEEEFELNEETFTMPVIML